MPTQDQFITQMIVYQCTPLEQYVKNTTRQQFQCNKCGQTFINSANKIKTLRKLGQPGCSDCYKLIAQNARAEKWTKAMRDYCAERGGTLVTPRITQIKDRVIFRCAESHQWEATAEAVKNLKTWCPHCAGMTPRTLDELRFIAESRGGRLLSTVYKNVDTTYNFECVLGHRFSNMFKKVEGGQWCPTCNKGHISEEVSRTTFEQLFGVPFQKERPQWLRNSRGRLMELDGANLELNLAFEYQGAQHFKKNLYITEDTKLVQRVADDETKVELCKEHGITLVILTHEMKYADFPSEIKQQLISANYSIARIDFDKPIDLAHAYVRIDRLEELRELLKPKQIEVLSNKWLSSDTSYSFRCLACEHEWKAKGQSFFNSRRVSGCDRCNRRLAGHMHRLDLDDLRAFAVTLGGELLSDTYTRRNAYYLWRCSTGHEFEGNYNNMAHRNQFCATCEGRTLRPARQKKQI